MKNKLLLIVLSYLIIFFEIIISFFYNPIFFRIISIAEFGRYNFLVSLASYFSLVNIGIAGTYLRFFYKLDRHDLDYNLELVSLNNSFLLLLKLLTILGLGLLFFFVTFNLLGFISILSRDLFFPFLILVIIELVNIHSSFMNGIIFTHNKLIFLKGMSFFLILIKPLLTIIILLIEPNTMSLVIVSFIISIVTILIKIYFIHRNKLFNFNKDKVKLKSILPILSFSALILTNMIVDTFTYSIGITILGIRSSPLSVSLYSISIQLVIYFITISTVINEVFITQLHKQTNSQNDLNNFRLLNVTSIYKLSFLSFLVVGFLFHGELFLSFWTNNKLNDAYFSTLIYFVALLIPLSQSLVIEHLKSRNRYYFKTIISAVSLFLFVILSQFSIIYFDFYGPIFSISFLLIIFNVVVLNIYYKKVKIDFGYFWKKVFLKIIPTTLLFILISYFFKSNPNFISINFVNIFVQVFITSSLYLFLFFFFILEKSDKISILLFIKNFTFKFFKL
jgi:O-antigen/teichoic acid export membrane protein